MKCPGDFLEPLGDPRACAVDELGRDDDYAFADRLGQKYGATDLRQIDSPGQRRVVVTLRPEKINTWGD